jgi:hypothetical protein
VTLEVSVTFDSAKGYVALVPDLAEPITALLLAVLRRRIEERLLPDSVEVRLMLDRAARLERDQRRRGGVSRDSDSLAARGARAVQRDASHASANIALGWDEETNEWGLSMQEYEYGVVLMVLGWIATVYGTYMSQGTWPAVAAFGLVGALIGMTVLLREAMRGR